MPARHSSLPIDLSRGDDPAVIRFHGDHIVKQRRLEVGNLSLAAATTTARCGPGDPWLHADRNHPLPCRLDERGRPVPDAEMAASDRQRDALCVNEIGNRCEIAWPDSNRDGTKKRSIDSTACESSVLDEHARRACRWESYLEKRIPAGPRQRRMEIVAASPAVEPLQCRLQSRLRSENSVGNENH